MLQMKKKMPMQKLLKSSDHTLLLIPRFCVPDCMIDDSCSDCVIVNHVSLRECW